MYYDERPESCNLTKESVYRLAESIADQMGYEIGGDLKKAITEIGGNIKYRNFWDRDETDSGSMDVHGVNNFDIYLADDTSEARDRFTLAHELGHYVLHFLYANKRQNKNIKHFSATRYGSDRTEWEANWFAAGFLMPEQQFIDAFDETGGDLSALSSYFRVSMSAAKVRAEGLNLI